MEIGTKVEIRQNGKMEMKQTQQNKRINPKIGQNAIQFKGTECTKGMDRRGH